jgi:hypothetical protein
MEVRARDGFDERPLSHETVQPARTLLTRAYMRRRPSRAGSFPCGSTGRRACPENSSIPGMLWAGPHCHRYQKNRSAGWPNRPGGRSVSSARPRRGGYFYCHLPVHLEHASRTPQVKLPEPNDCTAAG